MRVVSGLCEYACCENWTQSRGVFDQRRYGVFLEGLRECRFQGVEASGHDGEFEQVEHGQSQSLFDCLGLAQRVGAQSGKDVIHQRGVVAAATAMQQSDHASAGQGRGFGRGRGRVEYFEGCLVLQVREGRDCLGVELQQQRPQAVEHVMPGPDRFLVLAS